MRIGNAVRWAIAIALVILSFANASWLSPVPKGAMQIIAAKVGTGECPSLYDLRMALAAGSGLAVLDGGAQPPCATIAQATEQLPRYTFFGRSGSGDATSFKVIGPKGLSPLNWQFTIAQGRKCFADYVWQGWLTLVPASCKQGGTIIVPLDQKWKVAGWPKRFQARMADAGVRIILAAPGEATDAIPGLSKLDQIPEIPRDYTGYVWVDDIELIGRSIRR